jgi:membrane-bound lytic murein transglycosylase
MAQNTTVSSYVPFFTATVLFKNDKAPAGAYDCVACGNDIGDKNTPAAISYATNYLGSWAHLRCLNIAKIAVKDDKKAKKAAQAVHRDAFQAQYQNKAKTTTTVSSTPAQTTITTMTTPRVPTAQTFEEELRVKIEAEYEDVMQQALAAILARNERIATLESDNEKLAMELSKIMVASVATPAPTTTHNEKLVKEIKDMGRCGAQKKDGTACRWDTRKTACMHHNRAA